VTSVSTVGAAGAVVSRTASCEAAAPFKFAAVLTTRALIVQLLPCVPLSVIDQLVPLVVAVLHVVPPSKDTLTTSFAPRAVLIVP
jgi:hypothetical protein